MGQLDRHRNVRTASYSRRQFLSLAGASGLGVLLAACAERIRPSAEPPAGSTNASVGSAATGGSAGAPVRGVAGRSIDGGLAASVPAINPPLVPTSAPPTATDVPRLNGVAPDATPTVAPPAATSTSAPTVAPTATAIAYDGSRLKDKLGSAQTSYAGSIPERAWNVELAAKRLNGTKVAPGEVFSFNQAVGATTLKAGYKIGYGIQIKDDKPETIPSVAGGICQVATTVYQAAFWAGLPFVERHYHLYWIPRYGQPPSGKTGMDATVDDPGVDLKFKNITGDWIRLDSWVDGANIGFVIYGVDPGWDVEAGRPKIFDVVKADQEMVREDDPTMPPGKELLVEHAEDGFRVTMSRLVKVKGKILDELVYTNYYRPSRNVVLIGTKGQTPRPTVSTTASPAASGTPDPNATPGAGTPQATRPGATRVGGTPVPAPATPTPAGLAPGQVRVPSLIGLPEAQARKTIDQAGLANTYPNYQGPGQVAQAVLQSVQVGSVLSQTPAPGTVVAAGATVYLAVRKA